MQTPDPSIRPREAPRTLYSVAQIQHVLRTEFGRAQRYRYPLVCMLIAVDQLGTLRDLYGYDFKESVVEAVVGVLKELTRSSDFLGRTADDRLMAVIPHTSEAGARNMAERLLQRIPDLRIDGARDLPRITLSIGACSNQHEAMMYFDSLLSNAESALSSAIASGGDRYVEHGPNGPRS